MESFYKYKVDEVLQEVKACKLLYVTKNGKTYCPSAEQFIEWLNDFNKYCLKETKENWKESIRYLIYSTPALNPNEQNPIVKQAEHNMDYTITDELYNYMNASEIMQIYNETNSWEEIDKALERQGHSGYTFSGLAQKMLIYSTIGVDFIDRYDPNVIKRSKEWKKVYDEAKKRKEVNQSSQNVLCKK